MNCDDHFGSSVFFGFIGIRLDDNIKIRQVTDLISDVKLQIMVLHIIITILHLRTMV